MNELRTLLEKVSDAYPDFVNGMLNYADFSVSRYERLCFFLNEHPAATSSDIIEYVSGQSDFFDDADNDDAPRLIA